MTSNIHIVLLSLVSCTKASSASESKRKRSLIGGFVCLFVCLCFFVYLFVVLHIVCLGFFVYLFVSFFFLCLGFLNIFQIQEIFFPFSGSKSVFYILTNKRWKIILVKLNYS